MSDDPKTNLPYEQAMHAVQTGVAYEMSTVPSATDPKHLRVGINSALINDAALVRLLIKKGLITQAEYIEEVRLEACREVDRYEDRLTETHGRRVVLR